MHPTHLAAFLQYASQQPAFYPPPDERMPHQAAAVLVAFIPEPHDPKDCAILLTERAAHLRHHSGQIAFAGGKRDANDHDNTATALREAHEELGIPPETWCVYGQLPPLSLPSGYCVTPILAASNRPPEVHIQPQEVAAAFSVPCAVVLQTASYTQEMHPKRGGKMPVLHWQNRRIWGATAIILYQLALCHRSFV